MKQWHLVIDVEECEDCNNCFLSCKDEHVGNDFPGYAAPQPRHGHRWMNIFRKERGQYPLIDVAYLPMPCMHCDRPPCLEKAEKGAVSKREDGVVLIDPVKAKGQAGLVEACPYGAIWWNEEEGIPQKCTFCAHLLDQGWTKPRCVQACPTGALEAVCLEDSEMQRLVESDNLQTLHPEYGTRPRVYYKNLYRFLRAFIGGTVAFESGGRTECAEGAEITLTRASDKRTWKTVTDNYGDFRFDALEEDSGDYRIEVFLKDHERKAIQVSPSKSVNVGTISL